MGLGKAASYKQTGIIKYATCVLIYTWNGLKCIILLFSWMSYKIKIQYFMWAVWIPTCQLCCAVKPVSLWVLVTSYDALLVKLFAWTYILDRFRILWHAIVEYWNRCWRLSFLMHPLFHNRYDPSECGQYIISVRWSGVDVPGSPFVVHVVDSQRELMQLNSERPSMDLSEDWRADI